MYVLYKLCLKPFRSPLNIFSFGAMFVVGICFLATVVGTVTLPFSQVVWIICSKFPFLDISQTWPNSWETIIWEIRIPRIFLAAIVGASLSISGATYQGLFRNPLADPYLIGVSSGAGLGATLVLISGISSPATLPIAAFIGGMSAVSAAYLVSKRAGGVPLMTLILAGVAISSLAGALGALLMIRSDPDLRPVLSWLLGGFSSAQWIHSIFMLGYLIPSIGVIFLYSRILNVFQLPDEHVKQIGVNVERAKLVLIVASSLCTSAAVSFSGLIGFVGLIAPHSARLILGVDYRNILPFSMLIGSGFLVISDLAARTLVSPGELPVGIVTAFCGAPFFLYLLRKRQVSM